MKILIIGGTSSIASGLKPELSGFGEVITAGRRDCDVFIDLGISGKELSLPPDIDTIIHTAAAFGGKSDEEIFETEAVNVLGTLKLCQAAVCSKAKHFVLISSMHVCISENSPQYGIYALSKKQSEEVARLYCSLHLLPLAILRPSQIYGVGEKFREHQPFFYSMIDKAQKGQDITLYGNNDPLRNYIFIDDLTKIIAEVVKNKVEGVYSCTHTSDVTYSQIAKTAFKVFNTNGSVYFLKDKPDIADNIFDKDVSLYERIGYYPEISIEEGIRKIARSKTELV